MTALTQELKQQFQKYDLEQLNELLRRCASEYGQLEIVRYLLTSSDLVENAYSNVAFLTACQYGEIDIVAYALCSPDLQNPADIHAYGDEGFQLACENGHLDVVEYLLTSPDLVEHADMHAEDDGGFRLACYNGHFDIVHYLLSFDGRQGIDFQRTDYNLDWAINNNYFDIIFLMMKHLHQYDITLFHKHVETVLNYFMEKSIQHGASMIKEFHLTDGNAFTTECNILM